MENKYNELERLNNLRKSGTISETEFEVQKYRILNTTTDTKTKRNKSNILFICSIVGIIVSTILGFISYFWHNSDMYIDTLLNNKSLNKAISFAVDGSFKILVITTILIFILGIIFKIKEKGGIKIVD